uniref:Uncharacterized protein n=1 Tax=Candidatus Kentrum sp. LPFa TaxID=2126335 RepID=A0A450X1P2_9GAMM|nr:MAG: hypothetical protein BECKLPF1236A_GA0070988_100132 [Candidatus Kentron sp. LPFa]VFK23205.1 MAG: hypothetical protein BECKLPF1236C_GA0070990_1000411 [Candidatus Kentron sp. LPFa]
MPRARKAATRELFNIFMMRFLFIGFRFPPWGRQTTGLYQSLLECGPLDGVNNAQMLSPLRQVKPENMLALRAKVDRG